MKQRGIHMSKQKSDKMSILKKVLLVLLVLDAISLILAVIELIPTFQTLAGYGAIMFVVAGVMMTMTLGVLLFEIVAKLFLIRSTSPAFSWSAGRKGYTAAAKILLVVNILTAIVNVLSLGGEGATLLSQARTYLQILTAVVEVITVIFYLRAVKNIHKALQAKPL